MKRFLSAVIFVIAGALTTVAAAGNEMWQGLCWFNYAVGGNPNTVFSIFRDSSGRNWIGTTSGLFLFNGYQAYQTHISDWLFQAQVYAMAESDGVIYVGCNDGLFVLDPETNTVEAPAGDFPREIRALHLSGNTLWIGSLGGLYHYNIATGALSDASANIPHKAVYSLFEAPDGSIFVGTYNGLAIYDPSTATYSIPDLREFASPAGNVFVNAISGTPKTGKVYIGTEDGLLVSDFDGSGAVSVAGLKGNTVKSLAFADGYLVAGTDNGLYFISATGEPTVFRHDSRAPYSIASNVVWSLFSDVSGNIWCGTEVGLSIVDPASPVRVFSIADLAESGAGQQVYNMLRDSSGALWIGGSNGLLRLHRGSAPAWYRPDTPQKLSHVRVRDIIETSRGDIWVATDGGVNIYDRRREAFDTHYLTDRARRHNANWVYGVLEDTSDSTIWVAGYLGGIFKEKLSRFKPEGLRHIADTVFSTREGASGNDLIGQMVQDARHNKWVLNFRDSALTRISSPDGALQRVAVSRVTGEEPTMICADPAGGIWCGFYGGVVRIRPDGTMCDTIVHFPFGTGNESIRAMAPVGRGLWVATSSAVFAVNPATMTASLLPLPAKNYTSIYYDRTLRSAILGATDEIVLVDPTRILQERSGATIDLVTVSEGDMRLSLVPGTGAKAPRFGLPSDNRNIEIDLSSADFSPGQYLRFCYRLDGEKQWQLLPEGENNIHLTSLPSGVHTLELAVAGDPSARYSLEIDVARPWYRTRLAIALYVLAILGITFVLVEGIRRRQRRHIEEVERANALASVENRLFFLSNISHELKTPLSMIIGPLSRIRTGEEGIDTKTDIDTAYKNAIKLNSLIHQTVEINRMEVRSNNMLIYSRIDAVEFCRDIFDGYRHSVENRNFVFSADAKHIYVRTDAIKLESLLGNLLSNAVKYTGDGSTIALTVTAGDGEFEIDVADDGVGIAQEELSLVFQRLYRSPRTAGSREGTGIGLYLVRQYAGLLGGSVTVESRLGEGTTFRLRLPVGEVGDDAPSEFESGVPIESDKRRRVLIVDDNRSIASFIASLLEPAYHCAIANNGKAGLAVAASFKPDLIVADEMMPVMSGLEMSRRLKSNAALASVPILLLTAKDTPEVQGESIVSGVNAFMAKPFDAAVLRAKVDQLIESNESLRRNLRLDELTAAAPEQTEETASERLLARITDVIENNISNPDLNVDFLCRAVDMQSKALYRLLKKYVGVTPVDYIRQTRLRKAAMLLEQHKFSVSEVMYMVGFSSSSYFSKCFSAMFGCTPGQYPPSQNS